MTIDEAIKRHVDNADYERAHGNLQGCLEFKQLAKWLKELKQLREQEHCEDAISRKAIETIPLDKVKEIREEIDDLDRYFDNDYYTNNTDSMFKCNEVLEILDKLIESEEKE